MLLSMTGHGQATAQDDHVQVLVEIRSVNNRFLKISVSSELDAGYQSRMESIVRERIKRGSVSLRVKLQFLGENQQHELNATVIEAYQKQLEAMNHTASIEAILQLPGVISENEDSSRFEAVWPVVEKGLNEAVDKLIEMRRAEGEAMKNDLLDNCRLIAAEVEQVKEQAPNVAASYAKRISDRVNQLLDQHNVSVGPSDLVREIGIFAERVDISEELVRLDSHLKQFHTIADSDETNGRKLDFLTQELLRETNTIGSKANHADIASHVVEIKSIIERIREMVQNVE